MIGKKTKVDREEEKGGYTIRHCADGSCRIFGRGIKLAYGFYLPSESRIRQRYQQEMARDNRLSESMRTYLGYLGVVYTGKRSKKEGRKVLELSLPRFIGIDDIRGV